MKVFLLYTLTTFCLLSTIGVGAQTISGGLKTPANAKPARSLFVEIGGAGVGFTFNYDQRFKKQNNGWGFRAGIGGSTDAVSDVTIVPFQLNYLHGNGQSYFETGAGVTYLSGRKNGTFLLMGDDATTVAGTFTFAYRWQPVAGGVIFRGSFDPLFSKNEFLPFAGLSLGYAFAHTQIQKPIKQREVKIKNDSIIRAKSIFLEMGGPSFKLSVNYDTRFGNRVDGWGGRAGIGYMSSDGYRELVIPLQVNYLLGKNDKFLELGAGASYLTASDYLDYGRFLGHLKSTVAASATVGYRYQKKGGCIAGIAFTPLYNGYRFFPFGGFTLGYTFK